MMFHASRGHFCHFIVCMHLHIRTLLFMIISLFPECVLIMHACMINLLWSIYVLNLYHCFSKFYVYRVWILSFMSYDQSRFNKTEQPQYRRTGRSGPRYSGRTKGGGPGGGNAHPPSNRRYISVYELFQYLVLWFVEILHDDMCFLVDLLALRRIIMCKEGCTELVTEMSVRIMLLLLIQPALYKMVHNRKCCQVVYIDSWFRCISCEVWI